MENPKMTIDPHKVNLAEKDIEKYLWEHPEVIEVESWTGRQVSVPSGIIDLLGIDSNGFPVVVEVKNVPIDARALAQVCRYAMDVERIVTFANPDPPAYVAKVVIGSSIDNAATYEAEALGVDTRCFEVRFSLSLARYNWTDAYRHQRFQQYCDLSDTPPFSALVRDSEESGQADGTDLEAVLVEPEAQTDVSPNGHDPLTAPF